MKFRIVITFKTGEVKTYEALEFSSSINEFYFSNKDYTWEYGLEFIKEINIINEIV